jgi:hypothetical protein
VRRAASLALFALASAACARPAPPPTPTPLPTVAATVTPAPQPTQDAAAADVQDAFLANVNDLTSEVEDLASSKCDALTAETRDNPTEVTEIRGFAATLKRVGGQQPALNTDEVRAALAALDLAIGHLDGALATCGIKP